MTDPQTGINPNLIPYNPLPKTLTPFQESTSMLKLYQPTSLPINPGTANGGIPSDLPDALKKALQGQDPYANMVNISPVTTALPIAERYLKEPGGYSIYQDNEDVAAQYQDQDGFLTKQWRGDFGPLSLGWWGGLAFKAVGKFIDGFGILFF